MSARDHVLEFLYPIDPKNSIRSIAKRLWNAAETDDVVAAKFAEIQKMMGSGRPLIGEEHYGLYLRLKDRIPVLDIPTAPAWIRPAFAAGYLRAKAALAAGQVRGLHDVAGKLDTILKLLERHVESSFIGELLAETMLAASEDREFARKLTEAADEFRALATELYGPQLTDRPKALARAVGGGGGGGGDCTCCAQTPDGTDCHACSCWVIVVIIVIIIVSK